MKILNKKESKKGFTLLETLIALSIFSAVVTISVGSVIQILAVNRQSQSMKIVINNLNMALENMTIDLRFGTHYWCETGEIWNLDPSAEAEGGNDSNPDTSCSSITFIERKDQDIIPSGGERTINYSLEDNKIIRSIYNDSSSTWEPQSITASPEDGLSISKLDFYVHGSESSTNEQPRVLMVVSGTAGKEKNTDTFNLETVVSQRIPKDY